MARKLSAYMLAARPNSYHWSQVVLLAVAVCTLVVMMSRSTLVPSAPAHYADAGGVIAGRPIAELWAPQRPTHAWFTDAACRPLLTRFTCDHCLPLVYLASFPRSGNTWTRYLLEAATGLFTVSGGPSYKVYQNFNESTDRFTMADDLIWKAVKSQRELAKYGYIAENISWRQGVAIVAKTHFVPQPWNKTEADNDDAKLSPFPTDTARRAVLLIRDPFKAFISLYKYGATKSVHAEEDMTHLYRNDEWYEFAKAYGFIWFDMNVQWLEATNETHVIAYERLTRDTMPELRSLLRFLKVEPDERRMACLRAHLEGAVHNQRHGVVPDDQTYPLPVRAHIWSYIHQLHLILQARGYPGLPLDKYSFADEFRDLRLS